MSKAETSTATCEPSQAPDAETSDRIAAIAGETARLRWALFLDIDGTLIRHVPDPRDAVMDAPLRELLAKTISRLEGAVAFISGRRLSAIHGMLGPLATHAAGIYGLEMQWNGKQQTVAPDEPPALIDLAHKVERLFAGEAGLVVERKGPILSLNTGKRADLLSIIEPLAKETLADLPSGYRTIIGHAGLEIMPAAADKGAAIHSFMARPPFQGRCPIFIGDDRPDERGFAVINSLGGLSVRVLPAAQTVARHGLDDVDAVRQWLADPQFPVLADLAPLSGQQPAAAEVTG